MLFPQILPYFCAFHQEQPSEGGLSELREDLSVCLCLSLPMRVWPRLRHPCAALSVPHLSPISCKPTETSAAHYSQTTSYLCAFYTSRVTSHLFILFDNKLSWLKKATVWIVHWSLFPRNVSPLSVGLSWTIKTNCRFGGAEQTQVCSVLSTSGSCVTVFP